MLTNLEEIKKMAKIFLHLPIKIDEQISPLICVYHPFISSCIVYTNKEFINVLETPEKLNDYNNYMEKIIDDSDLLQIYMLIRKSYRLTFLKYCEPYLSPKDLAELFADAWVSSENPNQDVNCPISYLVKMFEKCDKKYLMTEEDYQIYESLPETFTIYRGVAVGRNPQGLSWTQSLEKAEWFAHRFDKPGGQQGYVLMCIAKKSRVLAYFNTRGEDEIVYRCRGKEVLSVRRCKNANDNSVTE